MTRQFALPALLLATFTAGVAVGRRGTPSAATPGAATPTAVANRVFELRTYTSPPGKLPDLHTRFRDHTTKLFEKHGMTNIGYWTPRDSARASNTIVYLLAYPSLEARNASWRAFGSDPEWRRAAAASEANGKIVEKVESVFLDPTDFSPMK
jgi:hypothetical protein